MKKWGASLLAQQHYTHTYLPSCVCMLLHVHREHHRMLATLTPVLLAGSASASVFVCVCQLAARGMATCDDDGVYDVARGD